MPFLLMFGFLGIAIASCFITLIGNFIYMRSDLLEMDDTFLSHLIKSFSIGLVVASTAATALGLAYMVGFYIIKAIDPASALLK